ncbi:Sigma-70, region 4 [Sinomicrobium oceani]|uniref:Sigma-70, region 4 n=1 Tax=Sinomicrobium oceani TaxID=1150368 RepID=A0A1K1NNK9_9FLAO|nr:sigma-70 family RNA polymerase sigma factor [Sinomicrobium oceani]SFW36851.1 Sigma-70, region 4 [Sinomicrobium oceani]
MEVKVKEATQKKDWDLFFTGGEETLYSCFYLFYNDLYRLGLFWFKDADIAKESIHNLFIELHKKWNCSQDIYNKKQYVITVLRRVGHKTYYRNYTPGNMTKKAVDMSNVDSLKELSYEDLLIASQAEDQRKKQLFDVMHKLTRRQQQMIYLRFFEGLSCTEIARITALSERTIYNTLHNAISYFRKHLTY